MLNSVGQVQFDQCFDQWHRTLPDKLVAFDANRWRTSQKAQNLEIKRRYVCVGEYVPACAEPRSITDPTAIRFLEPLRTGRRGQRHFVTVTVMGAEAARG